MDKRKLVSVFLDEEDLEILIEGLESIGYTDEEKEAVRTALKADLEDELKKYA